MRLESVQQVQQHKQGQLSYIENLSFPSGPAQCLAGHRKRHQHVWPLRHHCTSQVCVASVPCSSSADDPYSVNKLYSSYQNNRIYPQRLLSTPSFWLFVTILSCRSEACSNVGTLSHQCVACPERSLILCDKKTIVPTPSATINYWESGEVVQRS